MIPSIAGIVALFQSLLPPGRAFARRASSNLTLLLTAFAPSFQRLYAAIANLIAQADPRTADTMLGDWEAALGLPDPCIGQLPDIGSRRALAFARHTDGGGQNPQHFIDAAMLIGYAITITEHRMRRFGDPLGATGAYGQYPWSFTWDVNAPLNNLRSRAFGSQYQGPYQSWGNTALQCELNKIAPAHCILRFIYS